MFFVFDLKDIEKEACGFECWPKNERFLSHLKEGPIIGPRTMVLISFLLSSHHTTYIYSEILIKMKKNKTVPLTLVRAIV